jgi:hypothetical protein
MATTTLDYKTSEALADDAVCSEKAVAIPFKRAHGEAMHKVGRKPLTKRIVA